MLDLNFAIVLIDLIIAAFNNAKSQLKSKTTEEIRNLVGKGAGVLIGRSIWGSAKKEFSKITDQKINVLFAGMALFHDVRKWNRNNIDNYVEIYMKTSLKKSLKNNIQKFIKEKLN